MAVNVPGLIAIGIFYLLIAVVGILAARCTRSRKSYSASETIMVGGRDVGLFLGLCTMSATWVGGAAINGSAETVYDPSQGLLWTFGIPGFGIGLIINAIFFAKKMREGGYVTSIDPYQAKLGKYFGVVIFALEIYNSVAYSAAILTALGGTIEVVTGLPRLPAVLISTAISVLYTMLGGLYSVAYTDVIQLGVMIFGLVLAVPFTLTHEAVGNIIDTARNDSGWLGMVDKSVTGTYIDLWMVVGLGGIPLQVVYQRVFSSDTTTHARMTLIGAGIFSIVSVIPSVLMGAAAASTDWTMTDFMNGSGTSPADLGYQRLILPLAMQHLTPPVVAYFGLGAVSAAVMSSTDSTFLGFGSLFGRNIYKNIFRPRASEREIVMVMRIAIVLIGISAAAVSLSVNSIIALLYLSSDFTYVIYFPLFASVLYLDPNAYGAVPALVIAIVMRLGGGDPMLDWEPLFPSFEDGNFPIRTISALSFFITLSVFSYLAKIIFEKGYVPEKYDFFRSNLAHGGRTRFLRARKKPPAEDVMELQYTPAKSLTKSAEKIEIRQ